MQKRKHSTLDPKIHNDLKRVAKKANQKLAGFHDSIVILGLEKFKEISSAQIVNHTGNN